MVMLILMLSLGYLEVRGRIEAHEPVPGAIQEIRNCVAPLSMPAMALAEERHRDQMLTKWADRYLIY